MSKISDLIKKHCSGNVQFMPLEMVCEIANDKRKPVKSNLRIPGKIPYYGANNIQDYVEGYTHDGNFVLIAETGSASIEKYSIQYTTGKFWANNNVHVIRGKDGLDNRFLFHYLCNMNFRPYMSGGERAKLIKAKMTKIPIPIPHIDVQEEIATILDKFTKLESQLTAELKERKKQYIYYLNSLFSFDNVSKKTNHDNNAVIQKPLGDLGTFIRGNGLQKRDFTESGIGCIHYGQIYTHFDTYTHQTKTYTSKKNAEKLKKANKGDLVIATTSEDDEGVCKAVAWLGDEEIVIGAHAYIYKHSLNPKYVAYYFQTDQFQKQKRPFIFGAKVRDISGKNMCKIKIPVPSPEKQEKIVAILDKFDKLVNDNSIGLPAEISARRKQYEYYRNQLVSFEEPN